MQVAASSMAKRLPCSSSGAHVRVVAAILPAQIQVMGTEVRKDAVALVPLGMRPGWAGVHDEARAPPAQRRLDRPDRLDRLDASGS